MTWSTPSTRPRLSTSVMSVTQALNAASLAPAPKKLITASTTTIATTAAATAPANGTRRPTFSGLTRPNAIVDRPHRTYPTAMNTRRRPTRSLHAPTTNAARVAAIALAATVAAIAPGESVIVS